MMEIKEFNADREELAEQNKIYSDIKVYRKRWIILIIFMLFSISSTIQNAQYSVVANVIQEYYQVSYYAIDWTKMLGAPLYIIFSFPATYILDRLGLRKTVIIGIIGTSIGTWIKIASIHPDRFWVVLLGQGCVSLFTICFIPVLPKLAATWFGYKQIATATGFGVVGVEAGVSLSFLLPTLLVVEPNVEKGLYTITLAYAVFTTIMVPIVIFFFSNQPQLPPSYAQQNYMQERETKSLNFKKECKELFSNKNFLIFSFINAINKGSVGAVETLSNQIILYYYKDETVHVGIAGTMLILCSLLGSIIGSILIDKFKQFKAITWITYGSLGIALILFTTTIHLGLPMVYISLMLIGLFFGVGETLHFEVVIELTYPQSQNVSVGVSMIIQQITALSITSLYGFIHRSTGNSWANITVISIVLCTDLLFFLMKFNLRRSKSEMGKSNKANSN